MTNHFPPSYRLLTANEFKQVFQTSQRYVENKIAVFSCANNLNHPRLGLSISKRNIRKATKRNCIKRIARETFRQNQQQLDNADFIVVAYKGADTLSKSELKQCLEKLWRKLAVVRKT